MSPYCRSLIVFVVRKTALLLLRRVAVVWSVLVVVVDLFAFWGEDGLVEGATVTLSFGWRRWRRLLFTAVIVVNSFTR